MWEKAWLGPVSLLYGLRICGGSAQDHKFHPCFRTQCKESIEKKTAISVIYTMYNVFL
ncbi:hypothetical protein DPMN_165467 [Dreissena polymorpha]|uniref:Uncharacterized protein n=1 Tax=Dreissena polymorpha TaxID=45954 RepID=A0A9D4EUW1_DREPO|nr:hypothetical protein DPMN_165467 [Dreissena polymorpha]